MTPAEAFADGGFNPNSGLWVRDWYALGSIFATQGVVVNDAIVLGLRTITAIDVASSYLMKSNSIPTGPRPVTGDEVIDLLTEVFNTFQPPRRGVAIGQSVWYSSLELEPDENTAPRGRLLKSIEAEFGPMSEADKDMIRRWVEGIGIRCEFDPDNIS